MGSMNTVTALAHLTRDPELRTTPQTGTVVCNFGLATNRKRKTDDEVWFAECEAWGRTAEVITEHLRKGDPICATGRMKTDKYTDREGKPQSKTRFVVESFAFVSGGERTEQRAPAPKPAPADETPPPSGAGHNAASDPDDIPF